MSALIGRRKRLDVLADPDAVADELREFAVSGLGFARADVFLSGNGQGRPALDALPGLPPLAARALDERRTIVSMAGEGGPAAPERGAAVPILCGDLAFGAVVVEPVDPRSGEEPYALLLLEAAARDAGCNLIRIGSGREREDARARIAAMSRLEDAILNSTRLDEVLARGVRAAVETLGAAWGAAWTIDREGQDLRVAATFGIAASSTGQPDAEDRLAALEAHARKAIRGRGALRRRSGPPAVAVPVIAFGEVLGAIGISGRPGGGSAAFGPEDEPFLRLLAAHAALAIQNSMVGERQREVERRLHDAEGQLVDSAKLAALGEMSAKLAHEIRNPLSSIGGFARRIEKSLPPEDPNHGYAGVIARETQRLEAILTEHLELARLRPPRLAMVDLNATVRETIELVRPECESGGVKVLEAYETRIPSMLLDAGRIKQVLLNILKNARQSTREGQRIRVRTRAADGWAQVEIANDGEKLPGEIIEQLFVPFATSKNTGCGLGLAVADQIVKEHGGEIRVRTDPEWSVVFTVSFPIRTNQDRRKTPDRRTRDRRRAA